MDSGGTASPHLDFQIYGKNNITTYHIAFDTTLMLNGKNRIINNVRYSILNQALVMNTTCTLIIIADDIISNCRLWIRKPSYNIERE